MSSLQSQKVNAGRIIVVGGQAGGKTALATRLAARTDPNIKYIEQFGGTIETEFLRVSFREGRFFALLLPIGGQEKWGVLRQRFGETAEGIIVVVDSITKGLWPSSLKQALELSPLVPYEDYPVGVAVTKEDLNHLIRENVNRIAEIIIEGFKSALQDGLTYHSRGFRIIERRTSCPGPKIPFSIAEQIITNALEREYFSSVTPGSARDAVQLLEGFSLVNCRMFSRALTSAISEGETAVDKSAMLSLLNDMRPTLLELDTSWDDLTRKYPGAGSEPHVSADITEDEIKATILNQLLAGESDILLFTDLLKKESVNTDWAFTGSVHASTFTNDGLDRFSGLLLNMLDSVAKAQPSEKFGILEPLEPLF